MKRRNLLTWIASAAVMVIAACGGGGGSESVAKADQSISSLTVTPEGLKLGATAVATATASSDLTVSFRSDTPATCTTSGENGNQVRGIAVGVCTVAAIQSGNDSFNSAAEQSTNITIEPVVYDAMADFSGTANPNGVWSYGWMPTDLSLFNAFTASLEADWYAVWCWSGCANTPAITKNVSDKTYYGIPVGKVSLHPGPGYEASVLRWTAPFTGRFRVSGQFLSGDINANILVGVRDAGAWLWQGQDAGVFDLDISLSANSTLDFMVYGSYYFGNTPVELTITAYKLQN